MTVVFYTASAVAIGATILMLTRLHAVHALLYLILSLLAVAVIFYDLGAPFVAALGSDHLRGRHYGAVCVRRDAAEPGRGGRPQRSVRCSNLPCGSVPRCWR